MSRRVHAYTGKATVLYQPKIIDSKGQAHTWTFSHDVEPDRLQRAVQNRKEAAALADEISSCYHDELLASAQADDAYRCCVCGSSKVTTLLQHPVPYLQLIQPTVADMPGVVCASSYCAATHEKQYKEGLGGVLADRQSGAAAPFVAAGAALLAVAGVIIASVM